MNLRWIAAAALPALMLAACTTYEPYPRPMAYARIDLPASYAYTTFSSPVCPLTFEYPATGVITRELSDSCWVDIRFPEFDLKWHITYRDADEGGKDRAAHYEEYRRLIYKHTKKALRIEELPLQVPAGSGVWFNITGEVGTPSQVFLADSSGKRVVMISMYFQTALKNDSLEPVIAHMRNEMLHMSGTLRWVE